MIKKYNKIISSIKYNEYYSVIIAGPKIYPKRIYMKSLAAIFIYKPPKPNEMDIDPKIKDCWGVDLRKNESWK